MMDRVLVTGLSGFIASHVAVKLLEQGYKVRGTVRNLAKGEKIAAKLLEAVESGAELELVEANLTSDAGWAEAVKDCRYIQHIASPFPADAPDDREALVPEARAGAQRVLENGFSAGAERIVMTSSIVAMIGQQSKDAQMTITETDWTNPDWKPLRAYAVSKTRAEQSAWAYAKTQGFEDRLTTVNPGLVLGPDSFGNAGVSVSIIRVMLAGRMPRVPKLAYPIIDVRDCAAIHVRAMTSGDAAGRRLIAGGDTLWFKDIAKILKENAPGNDNLPTGEVPNAILRIAALFDDSVKQILPDLGVFHQADAAYVNSITHVLPRPAREAILAAAAL